MKICLDMRPALSHATGVGVYFQNLARELSKIDQENEYHLFYSSWKEHPTEVKFGSNFIIHDQRWPVRVLNFAWHRLNWPPVEWLIGSSIDVAHSPGPLLLPSSNALQITTVMDLYFYFHPEHTLREIKRDYKSLVQKHCQKSDAIISISEYTRQVLIEHFNIHPSRVYTIRLAADPYFFESVDADRATEILDDLKVMRPYFLFVGGDDPRKNLAVLLKSFEEFEEPAHLVIAGPIRWTSSNNEIQERTIKVGYVSREQLKVLYQESLALIMPSREEGFGLPLLEAMAAGTPVIGSDLPVFHEVCGDSFYPVPPNNVEAIRQAMRLMFLQPKHREGLVRLGRERVKKFSWRETAEKTLELYRSL